MDWSIERAITEFKTLSNLAFSKRQWLKVPPFRHTAQLLYSHRFKSEGINGALQKGFGEGLLYGFNKSSSSDKVKVGVVAGVSGVRRPYLFSNYTRNSTGLATDYHIRSEYPEDDLKIWEAARSTSAAPTYFEPYFHAEKNESYIDGALQRNNPVQILEEERHLIWTDKSPPDIILSIGTGIQADTGGNTKSANKRLKMAKKLIPKGLRGKIAVGLDMIQSTLDCDRQWNEFVSSTKWDPAISSVCHRLDIGLSERPPNLDDVDAMPALKKQAMYYLHPEADHYLDKRYKSAHEHILVVSRRLKAALFYFEEGEAHTKEKVVGVLHCRLSAGMLEQFERLVNANPSFCVHPQGSVIKPIKPAFDLKSFSAEVEFARPDTEKWIIEMRMSGWGSWESISGFSKL